MQSLTDKDQIHRLLTKKYVGTLVTLGLLMLTSYIIFLSYLVSIKNDSTLINISGRQRMLSLRISLIRATRPINTTKLNEAVNAMQNGHDILIADNRNQKVFKKLYFDHPTALDSRVRGFLHNTAAMTLADNDNLLLDLDHAVSIYEANANDHAAFLEHIHGFVLLCGIIILILSGYFVFRPMTIQLREEHNRVELLFDISVIANNSSKLSDAIQKTLDLICAYTGWPVGHAYEIDRTTPDLLMPLTLWHLADSARFNEFRRITERTILRRGEGLPGRVLESQRPVWVQDVLHDNNFPRNNVAADIGVRSAFAFPLIVHGRLVAVLEFFSEKVIEQNNTLLHIAHHIGQQLGHVGERQSSQEALRFEKTIADKANHAKSEFLANISHELRTPMHGILSYARLGIQRVDSLTKEKSATYFQEIYDSGSRLMLLLTDLLDLSKLEAGEIDYTMVNDDLMRVFMLVTSEMNAFALEQGLIFEVNASNHDTTALFDAERIIQVIRNLISNAIKFSNKGSVIRINLSTIADTVRCVISNSGVDIPHGELKTIFDKFAQSSKTKNSAGGTGLGLAICKEIIEQHGGIIRAESDLNKETRFIFEIHKTIAKAA